MPPAHPSWGPGLADWLATSRAIYSKRDRSAEDVLVELRGLPQRGDRMTLLVSVLFLWWELAWRSGFGFFQVYSEAWVRLETERKREAK